MDRLTIPDPPPRFDGGLLPVIVQDAADGTVLMLAWANREALDATLRTGQAHFWSRSRSSLWRKGATSGNVQRVVSVQADCDADVLLYRVQPRGPACHTGSRSCFGEPATAPFSLQVLERVIADRASADPERSYTARLLRDGSTAAAAKVTEEAGEVADAALGGGEDRVVEEAADLLYHLLVLLRSRQVPLGRVVEALAERHAARTTARP
ncbi:MAG TPA: bifunctional phosphoribosyl-AMP cyclohydrolase/phosphoribosyl-ATP diphosphatase HisIE [candidate division Zixibacteria bacterium]|nr:bifunctional phosphoribosyl-AMP cyclohydrolase/phosphoribosyl-ATP diphosphatase HisIE [candidate division Zixibacteria bacterium]